MEMKSSELAYLTPALQDTRLMEQTQELRLPEGMPDVGQIIGVWGQPVLRSKQWRTDMVAFTGGIQVWLAYRPENGEDIQYLDSWLPFQGSWDLDRDTPEGKMALETGIRALDARTVSPRKILLRADLALWVQALCPATALLYSPGDLPEDVQLLEKEYCLRLYQQAGEKSFVAEDTTAIPEHHGCAGIRTVLTDQKVVGNKLAFRGTVELTLLVSQEDGSMEGRNLALSFAQFAELEKSYGNQAEAELHICVTELELGDSGIRVGLTAQYAVSDECSVQVLEDAYSCRRSVELTVGSLSVVPILARQKLVLRGEAPLPHQLTGVAEAALWTDFPQCLPESRELQGQGMVQLLGYNQEGRLQGGACRWDARCQMETEGECFLTGFSPSAPQVEPAKGCIAVELHCQVSQLGTGGIPAVTDIVLGELLEPDPQRPSLILCRVKQESLWALAKQNGSTVADIRRANALEGECVEGTMLLIPIH